MADTTPTLREAAQQFVQDYENGDLGDLKHYARSMRAALAAEQAEPSEHRPDREWYARMIRETAGDDFVAGPAFKLPEQAEQAEPVAGFRLLPSRLTNEMRAAMADAARAYMARTGGNSPDAMYDAAVAAAPPAPAADAMHAGWREVIADVAADISDHPSLAHEKLRRLLASLPAPARQPAPALTVDMLMEAGLMVGSTPDSVGTSNWAARMLRALRMLAANQRTAAALTQPEGGA